MKRLLGALLLMLAPVVCAWAADPADSLPLPTDGGLVDPGKQLPAETGSALEAACAKLAKERSARLLVVIEPKAGSPRTAESLLREWSGAAKDAQAAVLDIVLETRAADLALSASLRESLPDDVRAGLLDARVKPALSPHATSNRAALATALVDLAERLTTALPAPVEKVAAPTRLPAPPPPPLWRHPFWWVGLPVLLWLAVVAARSGVGEALGLLPALFLLYGGLYLMLRFQPLLLVVFGLAAVAPVLVLRAAPSVAPLPVLALRRLGGFGQVWCPQGRGGL